MSEDAEEKKIISGSFATPEAVAHITPLGLMSNGILKASQVYLELVYEQLHRELLKQEVLHEDETTLQVLHEPGNWSQNKRCIWLYRTSSDTDRSIVMYEYQTGRGAAHPREFLEGFKGYLHTDGYAGHHNLPKNITVVGC